ncbi:MAG TPA: M28 family peptidase [Rubrobacteraceae bacterium]|nr:M28 family peptidase [Rubrobacteraceae bacterium]
MAGGTPSAAARTTEEAPNAEQPNVAEAAADSIDESSIRAHLAHLTGASPAPLEGDATTISERGSAEGRRTTAEYLEESFEEMGIQARTLEFSVDDRRGYNVEAILRGSGGGRHLWVTAHLDSTYNPGANDNASGLVSMLMTAQALERLDLEHTVHFVAYDLEEIGAIGSSRYVEDVLGDVIERKGGGAIIGNLNNDMVGYDKSGREAVMGTCNQAGPLDDALLRASEILDSQISLSDVCLGRSDHQNFWDAGLPAMVLTDGSMYDGYPWYHEPEDTLDKLDLGYLRSMIQLTAATAALLAAPRGEGTRPPANG